LVQHGGLRLTTAIALLVVAGCIADVDVGPVVPSPRASVLGGGFDCSVEIPITEEPTLRLTTRQYGQALRDVLRQLGFGGGDELVAEVMSSSIALPVDVAPPDPRNAFKRSYRRFDRSVGDVHIAAWYDTANVVAERIDCTSAAGEDESSCLRSLFARLLAATQRRPASTDDVARIEAIYGDMQVVDELALRDVIGVTLAGAEFVYVLASGEETASSAPDVFPLRGSELAARLAFTLWDSPADDVLNELAADGSLIDPVVFGQQVDRMLADPRAEPVVLQFFEDWLHLDAVADFTSQLVQPGYVLFAGDQVPTAGLRAAAQQEMRDLVMSVAWRSGQPLSSLLTTPLLFPRTAELASLYEVDVWDGSSAPPQDLRRPGILSRVALAASGLVSNRPVIKGVFVLDQLLCIELGPPPPGAVSQVVDVPSPHTTRDYLAALTESPDSSCIGCHSTINPFGYASEMFDGLGRWRDAERIIDPTSAYDFGSLPINTTSTTYVTGGAAIINNLDDVAREVIASGAFESCMVRHLFRHYASRLEQDEADGCWLQAMHSAAGGSVRDIIRAFVMHPSFRQRRMVE
jgi:hypothetical protein